MTYKPRTISIGANGGEPTDAEIKGRPITVCDTSDGVAASSCEVADAIADMLTALREAGVPEPDVLEIGKLDDETANLKAHIQTLQGRLEALERTVTAMRERDLKVRRAVGQFASAYDLGHK